MTYAAATNVSRFLAAFSTVSEAVCSLTLKVVIAPMKKTVSTPSTAWQTQACME